MNLIEEKVKVLSELSEMMLKGVTDDTKLTHDILVELRDKINNLIENDF
jgi:hypothetical protein